MLVYAWNDIPAMKVWSANAESAPSIDALLALILEKAIRNRLRIGLGRSYTRETNTLRGIRGQVEFSVSLKKLAFENGQAVCNYGVFSPNVPKNQIVRSTLMQLVLTGDFGPDMLEANRIRHTLRRAVRDLEGIDIVVPRIDGIRRQQLGRNDADYSAMLAICEMLLLNRMPTQSSGVFRLPSANLEELTLERIYERFVANFYRKHLAEWAVSPQSVLNWNTLVPNRLPIMKPDLVMQNKKTGQMIVLDTKYTANMLVENRWGNQTFSSSHIYQIYAYLRSQEHKSQSHRQAAGILLYPTVHDDVHELVDMDGHRVVFGSIDLRQKWEVIESNLLRLVEHSTTGHLPLIPTKEQRTGSV